MPPKMENSSGNLVSLSRASCSIHNLCIDSMLYYVLRPNRRHIRSPGLDDPDRVAQEFAAV